MSEYCVNCERMARDLEDACGSLAAATKALKVHADANKALIDRLDTMREQCARKCDMLAQCYDAESKRAYARCDWDLAKQGGAQAAGAEECAAEIRAMQATEVSK